MPAHEQFQEMCAAASIGQLAPEELAALERHLADCADCRRAYADFSEISGLEYSLRDHDTTLNSAEANRYINSSLLRRRFLARAEDEGIVFSKQVDATISRSKLTSFPILSSFRVRIVFAAAAALIVVASTSFIFYRFGGGGKSVLAPVQSASSAASHLDAARLRDSLAHQAQLESQVSELQDKVADLQSQVRIAAERESKARTALEAKAETERRSIAERDLQSQSLEHLRQELKDAEASLLVARKAVNQATVKSNGLEAALVADQVQINDLSDRLNEKTADLDRERQMLQAGREVRDLMAARNLHIVDVFDTDFHGKTKPIFGRVFFTEGKSLVFYAYDLNQSKIEKGGEYRVWGMKEGQEKEAKSLGIFYSDDASQRRWVFKYNDPKVLDEIDSVFVTFEAPGENPARPKGQKLMDAYLRAQPNHP